MVRNRTVPKLVSATKRESTPANGGKKPATFFESLPKHRHISELLRKRILTQMKPGTRIPAEITLSAEFGVSRETLRQALATLEHEGLISRTRGRGSFVTDRQLVRPTGKITGNAEDFVSPALKTNWRLVDHRCVSAEGEVATYLGVATGVPVMRFDRIKYLKNEPLAYHMAFLQLDVGARIASEKLYLSSITASMAHVLNIPLEEDQQIVEADAADVTLSEYLQIPIGSPLLQVRRLYISTDGRRMGYFKTYFRSDRYVYTVRIERPVLPFGEPVRRKEEANESGASVQRMQT